MKEKGLGAGCDVISPSLGPELATCYRSLLNILALPLSPNGSEGLLDEQCRGICARFRRYAKGNGSLMDSQDDLQVPGDGVDPRSLRGDETLEVFTTEPSLFFFLFFCWFERWIMAFRRPESACSWVLKRLFRGPKAGERPSSVAFSCRR